MAYSSVRTLPGIHVNFICIYKHIIHKHTYCCCSLSHVRLRNPIDYSMPGFPVLHYLLEFVQSHAHWVGDAIQPSHPLPSPPAFSSCLQSFPASGSLLMSWLFALGGQSIGPSVLASVLPMNNKVPLGLTGLISLQSTGFDSDGKDSAWSAGDLGSITSLGRSPGEGNGNPVQYPCL